MKMILIDGASAEGGGQIPRTALALSMVTGHPFRIENIRANRRKTGLMAKHLAVIQSAIQLSSAGADGVALSSNQFTFFPGDVVSGDYTFKVPANTPAAFVMQTMLPVLATSKGLSTVTIEGGIANAVAPPPEFLTKVYLPQIGKMGPKVSLIDEQATGLASGVGRFRVNIEPAPRFRPLSMVDRGVLPYRREAPRVASIGHRRELEELETSLAKVRSTVVDQIDKPRRITLEIAYESITEVFTTFATAGGTLESMLADAKRQARMYIQRQAAICEFLADQLLVPMALSGGGSFTTTRISPHAQANMDVIRAFLGVKFRIEQLPDGGVHVEIRRAQ